MRKFNFWKTLAFSVMALTAFAGCSDSDDEGGNTGIPSITVNGAASANIGVTLAGQNPTAAVAVASSGKWTLSMTPADANSWITPSATSGAGASSLTFNVAAATAAREATVTLSVTGSVSGYPITKTATILIKQSEGGSTTAETNVAAIRALLKAMNPTKDKAPVTAEIAAMTITGVVVSDFGGHNFGNDYNIAVQDAVSAENTGLTINGTQLSTLQLTPGTVVSIPLTAAKVNEFYGVLQLAIDNGVTVTTTPGTAPVPAVITIDKLPAYESQLVKIENCQAVSSFVGAAWNTTDNKGNVDFETQTGLAFKIRSGSKAAFKDTLVPDKSGFVVGIGGNEQVSPRTAADLAGLDQTRFTIESTSTTIGSITGEGKFEVKNAVVAATYESGFLMQDATGVILVYQFAKGTEFTVPAVGKKVTVVGTVEFRNGVHQFGPAGLVVTETGTGTPTTPAAVTLDGAAVDALYAAPVYKYVKYTGRLVVSGTYYNVVIDGATTQGSLPYPNADLNVASFNDKIIDLEGWVIGTAISGDKHFLNTMLTKITANTSIPDISGTPESVAFTADGEIKTVAFTVANVGNNHVYAKITGTNAGQFSVATVASTSPVSVTAHTNSTPDSKSATLEIYIAASEVGTAIASATVPLTQAGKLPDGAKTATFDFSGITTSGTAAPMTVGGITITPAKATGQTAPAVNKDGEWRLYAANTLTVSGATITKIEYTFTGDTYSNFLPASVGTYTAPIWTGSATSIVFTSTSEQVNNKNQQTRMSKIVVTYTE